MFNMFTPYSAGIDFRRQNLTSNVDHRKKLTRTFTMISNLKKTLWHPSFIRKYFSALTCWRVKDSIHRYCINGWLCTAVQQPRGLPGFERAFLLTTATGNLARHWNEWCTLHHGVCLYLAGCPAVTHRWTNNHDNVCLMLLYCRRG